MHPIVRLIPPATIFGAWLTTLLGFDWAQSLLDGDFHFAEMVLPRYPAPFLFMLGVVVCYAAFFAFHWFAEASEFYRWWLSSSRLKNTLFPLIGQAYLKWKGRDPAHKMEAPFLEALPFPSKSPFDLSVSPEWAFFIELCEQVQMQMRGAQTQGWLSRDEAVQFNLARIELGTKFHELSERVEERRALKIFNVRHALKTDCRVIKTLTYLEVATALALHNSDRVPVIIDNMERIYIPR